MILNDLVDLLESEEFGIAGEDIFYNRMIDEPDNQIVLKLLPGFPFYQKMTDVKYSVQVLLRNTDYDYGYNTITKIANYFHDRDSRYLTNPNTGRRMRVIVANAPVMVNIDESQRALYSLDLYVISTRDE